MPQAASPDPEQAAAEAGLQYVTDRMPGLSRRGCGKGFAYYTPDGKLVRDKQVRDRIRQLAIPPAYREVWICPDPQGHLQATGLNEAGQKQYLYHPRWREVRDEAKYTQMIPFGELLPKIRRTVKQDLQHPELSREKVLATVVKLLDTTHIRVGNQTYAEKNASYGLTTLRKKHVETDENQVSFEFSGKAGKDWEVTVDDPELVEVIRQCEAIPGYELFKYLDEDGNKQTISSGDVNSYLQAIGDGEPVTAKYFRTWAGTIGALEILLALPVAADKQQAEQHVIDTVKQVAERLGNTPAICRSCYIHPRIIERYLDGGLSGDSKAVAKPFFSATEALALDLLREVC